MANALGDLSRSNAATSCGSGRKAGEIVIGATEEVAFGGGRDGFEILFFEFGEKEAIDFGASPFLVLDVGRFGMGDWAERPKGALFGSNSVRGGVRRGSCLGGGLGGPNGAVLDPSFDVGNFGIFEAAGGRHLETCVGIAKRFDYEAGGGISGDDDGA